MVLENPALVSPQAVPAVRRLMLGDFRSYAALDLEVAASVVVLTGENGAGKTNLLEALSLLTAGRGLRRAELSECARQGGTGGFAISAEIDTVAGRIQLGTGIDPSDGVTAPTRRYKIERTPVASIRSFADYIRVVWLTPAMDGLFAGPAGERRRFLDRLVLAIDAGHGARVTAMERALRNRNRLLEEDSSRSDRAWLDAAEREVAELAVAVAAARHETVSRLCSLIAQARDEASPFPFAGLKLEGDVETLVATHPALEAEELYRAMLHANRRRDAQAGRTLIGPQASDLAVQHGPKGIAAALCSTGEQKALLVGLVLAHAELVHAMSGIAPLLLLDEIGAHFDAARRSALYASLESRPGQVWMTGADLAAFAPLQDRAQMFRVTPGLVQPA
jgi:DNA replication and repair protein RecF